MLIHYPRKNRMCLVLSCLSIICLQGQHRVWSRAQTTATAVFSVNPRTSELKEDSKLFLNKETEETIGRQHQRVDWPWMEYHTKEIWEPRGVEEAGCKIYSSAPMVSQYGIYKIR